LEVGRSCLFCFVPKKGTRNDTLESYILWKNLQ
jgi:hypothetical protein